MKLHGDYKDVRIRNISEELKSYPPKFNRLLDRIFDEHGLIVCGWSGEWDHALRAAILRTPNRRYPTFWMSRGEPRAAAAELINHRKAQVVESPDADTFFKAIEQRVETLEQSRRQNPLSIDLLVGSTKRYLAKPEHRIQLDELFSEEANRVLEQLDDPAFNPYGETDRHALQGRVAQYEAVAEGLTRMSGVLGRWGDGSELTLILDIIRSLYAHAEKVGSGNTFYLGLRSYPALLSFVAYGLGLARSQRWNTLHELFVAHLAREYRESRRTVELILPSSWKGDDNQAWNLIAGTERRYTPLSEYLLQRFLDWGGSFAGLTADFSVLFDRFELLGALAYLETNNEAELESALAEPHQRGVLMPGGRFTWRSRNRDRFIEELMPGDFRKNIRKAGFAHGSERFLDLFADNITRMAGRPW